ncbi:MAG TPA: 50S ribosomal protein L32 [Lentisphaeria bacterium]|nr:MAG: 50S ribosomal protein L32 [Lentisphaerae bacterium GWF2_50_93]HCE46889.1 50S ribosomal protein L32 [Lentisphaeria bacterium]
MGVPKRKMSKMKRRQRQAANRCSGVQGTNCTVCGKAVKPHRVCPSCGTYKGKQVITVSEK